jgi:flagellar basal-body rod protein FlgG
MIRSLWTGTTGMHSQQLNIDVIANNLANVNTTGFKKSRADFQDLLYQTMKVPGSQSSADTESPTGILVGLGVKPAAVGKVFTQGDLILTENELDIAIEGEGFLQIEMPNGATNYTRSGALKLDSQGRLTTSDGNPLIPAIAIPDGSRQITISEEGIVSAVIGDETVSTELGNIELALFTNNAGLSAVGRNLFQETNASGPATDRGPRHRRLRHPAADLPGGLQRQYRRGAGQPDLRAAGLRDQLEDHPDLG